MSKALPGMHYCEKHQGNHSHYADTNCLVCRSLKVIDQLNSEVVLRVPIKWVCFISLFCWVGGFVTGIYT